MSQNQNPDDPLETDPAVEANHHITFRRCSHCGSEKMAPVSKISETGFVAMTTFGQIYRCPQCETKADIRATGSIVTSSIFAIGIAYIGWLAFINGPYWYATNYSYFKFHDGDISLYLIDVLVFIFYSLVATYSVWNFWNEVIIPLRTIGRNPVCGENRVMSNAETLSLKKSRNKQLIAFFLFPLIVYVPLLGGIWVLDTLGIDVRADEFYKFAAIAITFAFAIYLAKRFKVEFGLVFFGMVFWMVVVVSAIFLL